MPLVVLEAILEPLFLGWRSTGVGTSFGDYVTRLGQDEVWKLLNEGDAASLPVHP